ncbi:MAG: dTDP-4-dehydrorhamnose 3,5-epimerase [Acidobacteria bacterium]|nr:dTDP-4-dehydrorhamnose 3,5-epimerase [Acidobacteriota bacterium]
MNITPTAISEVKLIEPRIFGDARGWFLETWEASKFAAAGLDLSFVQDNHSYSLRGTLRGLHYQIQRPQGKLVRVVAGEVFDVAVDLRRSSPTFGRWVGMYLSAENKHQLWIPPGFAHGFYVVSEKAEFVYKCTDFYAPEYERTLQWDDPSVGVRWPLLADAPLLLSLKDQQGTPLSQTEVFA